VLTKLPYLIAKLRGDLGPAKECAENILRYLSWLDGMRTERGTVDYGLGDWVPITKEKTTPELTSTLIAMDICRMASVLFDKLGQPLKKQFADTLRADLREAVRLNFIDFGTMTVVGNCQTAQAMALDYGAFDPGESAAAFRRLREIIQRSSDHLDCGFLGLQSIFRVLAEYGEADLAYKLITRKDPPSFGDFVARGMTSLPEDFHKAGEKPNSLNHHFLGGFSAFFIAYVGGIRVNPYDRNAHELLIAPCFIEKLDNATAHHETPDGKITVNWERDGSAVKLTVAVPDGAVGQIRLPNGYCFADTLRTFRPLESGAFTAVNTEAVPDNVIEL
ncbi:MAG: hypothetical protein II738_04130, partial [Clostridia bacterium]|nr:hypothetical protein [Clostridia bacterium]